MAGSFHSRDTVLPVPSGGIRHHVDRPWSRIERKAFPFVTRGAPKAELARRAQRQPEYSIEVRFIAVPTDADAGIVFGTEDLGDFGSRAAEPFDTFNQRCDPWRDRIGLLQTTQRVVVAKAERRHSPLALILAELKRLQRKRCDAFDQIPFGRRRNEFGGVTQTPGSGRRVG